MEIHSSSLAWETPWTEELGELLSMESRRVGHTECTYAALNRTVLTTYLFRKTIALRSVVTCETN